MKPSILVIDTSMLLVHLCVPGYARCGPEWDCWDARRINDHLDVEKSLGTRFVMPLAVIIETANHIARCTGDRFQLAHRLKSHVTDALAGRTPWIAFSQQSSLWETKSLEGILATWPQHAAAKVSLADHTISMVANFYSELGHPVEILTGDAGLKSLEPIVREPPRRRRYRT